MLEAVKSLIHAVDKTTASWTPPVAVRSSPVAIAENNALRHSPASEPSLSLRVAEKAKQAANVVHAAAHIAPLNPVGFVAAAFTGPKIETSQGSYSIPQLLTNVVVNRVEEKYAAFVRDANYEVPRQISSWPELFERLPSRELLEGGFGIALTLRGGGKSSLLKELLPPKKKVPTQKEKAISETQKLLERKNIELENLRGQLKVMQRAPDHSLFTDQIKTWTNEITRLEGELGSLSSKLEKLNKEVQAPKQKNPKSASKRKK